MGIGSVCRMQSFARIDLIRRLLLLGVFSLALASPLSACPVCFGAKDSSVSQAIVPAIGVLLGCTGLVATGIGSFAARLVFRDRKQIRGHKSVLNEE